MKWIKLDTDKFDKFAETWSLLREDGRPTRLMVRHSSPWGDGWCLLEDRGDKPEQVLGIFSKLELAQDAAEGVLTGGEARPLTLDQLHIAGQVAETGCNLNYPEAVVDALIGLGIRPSSLALSWDGVINLAKHLRQREKLIRDGIARRAANG